MFIGYISENQDLYTELQESGFLLKFKPVLYKEHGFKQGNVDADLVLNIMVLSPNIDKCSALLKKEAQDKIDFVNNFKGKVEKQIINEKAPLEDETSRSAFS